jgi:hypothetical protein
VAKGVGYLVALALLVAALFTPAWVLWDDDPAVAAARVAVGDPEPTTITDYAATFDLGTGGDLVVEEALTVRFPVDDVRGGLTRYFDRVDGSDDRVRRPVEDVTATLDGVATTLELTTAGHGRFDVATIGDPDVAVTPGEHRFVIRYRVQDALAAGSDRWLGSLSWDLLPSTWPQDIEKAELTVRLPSAARDVQCGIGSQASPPACQDVGGQDTTILVVRTGPLPAHTPVRVRIGLAEAPTDGEHLPWQPRYDVVLGRSVRVLGLVLGASVLAGLLGLLLARRGRARADRTDQRVRPPVLPVLLVVTGLGAAAAAAVWNPFDMSLTGLVPGAFAVASARLLRTSRPAGGGRRRGSRRRALPS